MRDPACRGARLLSVQVNQTPGLYAWPGVYPGPGFYPKFYGIQPFSLPHSHLPFMINLLFVLLAPPLLPLFPSFMLSPLSLLPTPIVIALDFSKAFDTVRRSLDQLSFKSLPSSTSQTTFLIGFRTLQDHSHWNYIDIGHTISATNV